MYKEDNITLLSSNNENIVSKNTIPFESEKKEIEDKQILTIPLSKIGKQDSIFNDKYKLWREVALGGFLDKPVYFRNEIVTYGFNGNAQEARAGKEITIELLQALDKLKTNFTIRKSQISDQEIKDSFTNAMGDIIAQKEKFFTELTLTDPVEIQTTVKGYIDTALTEQKIKLFDQHYQEIGDRLEVASSILTSSNKYLSTAAALKKIIETEQAQLGLNKDKMGETTEHLVKTAWLALALAEELDDFGADDYKLLALSALSHDDGKALIPETILYKKERLTSLEFEIIKTHIYLGFILSTNNQSHFSAESFIKALHHQKEDPKLPSSYSITEEAHTSYYDYLNNEAKQRLVEYETLAIKFARVMNIVDAFEAITAERKYKRGSSIGQALHILENDNNRAKHFYQPYFNTFTRMIIKILVPEYVDFIKIGDTFKISDYVITNYIKGQLNDQQKESLKENFSIKVSQISKDGTSKDINGIICNIENNRNQKVARQFTMKAIDIFKETSMHILHDMCLNKDFYGYIPRSH